MKLINQNDYGYLIIQTEIMFRDLFGLQELEQARKEYGGDRNKLSIGYVRYLEKLTKRKLGEQDNED